MNILDIYKKYQIMPNLAEHQLRVAAVGDMICGNWNPHPDPLPKGEGGQHVDRENIVAACLLHDMGNIVKFDFSPENLKRIPGLVNVADIPRWEKVKNNFIKKYGTDSHAATVEIVKEIGVSPRVFELVDSVGFEEGIKTAGTNDAARHICSYADQRVMPLGVSSLEERFADLRIRYHNHPEGQYNREDFENALRRTEKWIFEHCNIKPSDITEEAITDRKEKLKNFDI